MALKDVPRGRPNCCSSLESVSLSTSKRAALIKIKTTQAINVSISPGPTPRYGITKVRVREVDSKEREWVTRSVVQWVNDRM